MTSGILPDDTSESGLAALVLLLRYHEIPCEPDQIRHEIGADVPVGVTEIVRYAKDAGLKVRAGQSTWKRLETLSAPAIGLMADGSFLVIGKAAPEKVIVQRPSSPQPELLTREDFEARWSGTTILFAKRATLGRFSPNFDVTWFLTAMNKYRGALGEVLLASFFLQILALVSPLFFQVVIDKVLVHGSLSTLQVLVVGLLGVSFVESILAVLRTHLFVHTTNRIDVELGASLFKHLLSLPLVYFQSRRAGDSIARVRELENIRNFITSSAVTLVIDLFFAIMFIAIMFLYSSFLTWIVIASIPIYMIISISVTPMFRHLLDQKFQKGAENQSFLVETVTGIETLKALAVEPQTQRRWEEQLAAYVSSSFRVLALGNSASQAVQFVSKLVTVATLYYGALQVSAGDLTVGELVAFNILASRVSTPVLRIAQLWQDFHQARISIQRLGDILNAPPESSQASARAALAAIRGDITFENVSFRYQIDGPQVLRDISFSIPAGQVVGVVGMSGSGKSTLAKLIQRLYIPESGRILVDGIDLALVNTSWLRRQIGVVLQEDILFNRSVRENIALGDLGLPIERIIEAATLAGAHEFIAALPGGYDAIVGERGSSLSGGQKQRIAIARALVRNPRILIFDEATSALDYESERAIQANMQKMSEGRTVVIIAHRLSAVRFADRILTLDKGELVEDGSHDELLRTGTRYANLFRLQGTLHGER